MGLLGNLLGSSSKSSSTSTAQTDNRRVLGDGAMSLEISGQGKSNSGGVLVDGYGNTSNVTSVSVTSDLGAIQAAQAIAAEAARMGGAVADSALSGAFHFGSDSLGLAADAMDANALALSRSLDFGANAMDYATGAFGSALTANGKATADALGFGETAMAGSLRTAGNALDSAFSSMLEALGFGRSAMSNVGAAWGNATASADASRDSAFRVVDSVVGNAVDVISDRANAESSALRSIYETALGQINTSNARLGDAYADSQGRGALTDKMLMLAIGGAFLIAVMAVRK